MLKGSMLHKRSSYVVTSAHAPNNPENGHSRYERSTSKHERDAFSDLRIDVRESQPQQLNQNIHRWGANGNNRRKSVQGGIGAGVGLSNALTSQPAPTLTPSKVQHALRRCHSASAVRKRLQSAMELSSCANQIEQIEALRSLGMPPTTPTATNRDRPTSFGPQVSATSGSITPSGRLARSSSGVVIHRNARDGAGGTATTPSRGPNWSRPSSAQHTGSSAHRVSSGTVVSEYKSSCVQMEVELAERLDEIDRSKLQDKTLARLRACQHVFDTIADQDELYGRLLARVRDEFSAYIDSTAARARVHSNNIVAQNQDACWACGHADRNPNGDFELAALYQENKALKKSCGAMQDEIARLQAALREAQAANDNRRTGYDEGEDPEDELDDIELCALRSPTRFAPRPLGIPPLNFGGLSPYDEDEDADDEDFIDGDIND